MWSTLSLSILPGPLWLGVAVPSRVPSIGQTEPVFWVWHKTASDGEALVLGICGVWSTLSLSLLPGPLWLGVAVPGRVPSIGQIEPVFWVWHETASDGEALVLGI